MISAKYRLKEERRRMLKLSVNKLRRIEDPESALRRSVLINNTVRRLQREQREQREARNPAPVPETLFADAPVTPLRELRELREEEPVTMTTAPEAATPSQVLEELEDVLSQFYMPPTPRMITSIDEDEARDSDEACRRASPPSPPRPSSPACPSPAKRPRLDRLDADDEARALADPTNTLEDFKDEVYLRTKPRVPLASAPCANATPCEEALRADYCSRRYTHTGHDRENIAPYFGGLMAAEEALSAGLSAGAGVGQGAGLQGLQLQHSLQHYSCSQAHGQAQATLQSGMQHGLVFHGLMASMES